MYDEIACDLCNEAITRWWRGDVPPADFLDAVTEEHFTRRCSMSAPARTSSDT